MSISGSSSEKHFYVEMENSSEHCEFQLNASGKVKDSLKKKRKLTAVSAI